MSAERWPDIRKLAFEAFRPAALALVATDGPVSVTLWSAGGDVRRIGGNRGCWPAKIARTGSWRDTVTTTHDKGPFFALGMQFRLWCATEKDRDRLAEATLELIARRAEEDGGPDQLLNGFADLGPELDLGMFDLEIRDIADRIGVRVWDDGGLIALLDRAAASVERQQLSGRGLRNVGAALEAAIVKDIRGR